MKKPNYNPNNLKPAETKALMAKIESILQNLADKLEVVYQNGTVVPADEITDMIGKDLPEYQRKANKKWMDEMLLSYTPRKIWYYEAGDSLFMRKGLGWICLGGGFKTDDEWVLVLPGVESLS